ncbi:hypothetical protein B9Z55_007269 [Caenorhabditis nigoni]|uniref:Uncharacterized protein n=1 Tax=Caenorhabditis nigoni TaxID=1611254 RepID=A0A2G5V968_9PELO|nr:hypothetical protein B9Z55_007269 [Caenorhabditis nigoni]
MNLWRKSPKFIISAPECCGSNGPAISSSTFSNYTFGIIQRVNHIGGLIILSYLRSDQSSLYKLKKPTTRCLHSSSFQLVQLYDDRLNGSAPKEGQGWMRMDHEDNSEED